MRCPLCGERMRKKGFTSAGRQRWLCPDCRFSGVLDQQSRRRMAEFRAFLDWVTGTRTMRESAASIGVSRQAFASRVAWCWNVRPSIAPDGVVHHYIEADGTYVPYGWCLLVATGEDGGPLAWQWCDRENAAAYRGLFGGIARPDVLVTDGGAGCVAAAGELWEDVRVQRCLVHVLRNTRRDLTGRPRSEAGRELLRLARRITKVADADGAAAWLASLNAWHAGYGELIRQRTRAREDPGNPKARAGRKWWYTHERLRRAYFRFVGLNRRGVLFAFCDPALAEDGRVASTTNQLEGGVNAEIKRVLNAHRGLGEEHMRRCCEWVVYMRSANPRPEAFVTPDRWTGTSGPVDTSDDGEPAPGMWTDVQLPAPGVDAHENGFGVRKGWAGRS